MELRQNEEFLKKAYHKALLPCILSVLSGNLNILADGILVGQRLGTNALAAINFSLPVYLTLCILGSFIVSGTAICASGAIGKNRPERAQALYQTAIFWCAVVSVAVTALGLLLLRPLSAFLCPDPAVTAYVTAYCGVTLAGASAKILIYIPFWFLRLDGRNALVTQMMLVMGLGNVALDIVFLYLFNWGVGGAALASVAATAAACALGFARLCDRRSSFRFGLRPFAAGVSPMEIARAGSPSAANNLFQTLRVSAINALLLRYCGSGMVAAFTAVNCVAAFEESVTGGVPQAASAMLGIYSGEYDNESIRMLMRRQMKSGVPCCLLFSAVVIAGADLIQAAYGLATPLRFALVCMSLGMIPALVSGVLSGYYNVSGRTLWANAIICLRVFVLSCLSLYLLLATGHGPWMFLCLGEVLTLAAWLVASGVSHRLHPERSRFLLAEDPLSKRGSVINFSVADSAEAICDASGRITDFCEANGMLPRQTLRVSLAMEEIMTLIAAKNEGGVEFDLRVYSLQGVIAIRIRYSGRAFNPLAHAGDGDDAYMGIRLIESMVEQTLYQRTFGMNTVQIYIEGGAL